LANGPATTLQFVMRFTPHRPVLTEVLVVRVRVLVARRSPRAAGAAAHAEASQVLIATNLFAAGQETTARLLGVMFQLIGARPELQQLLRDERDHLPNFTEECLRLETPLQSAFRLSRVATEIGDVPIPAGTTVMLLPAAANRDPRRFDDPAEFRLDRPNWRQYLAFGFRAKALAAARQCPNRVIRIVED
jgi:cytochrome P450